MNRAGRPFNRQPYNPSWRRRPSAIRTMRMIALASAAAWALIVWLAWLTVRIVAPPS